MVERVCAVHRRTYSRDPVLASTCSAPVLGRHVKTIQKKKKKKKRGRPNRRRSRGRSRGGCRATRGAAWCIDRRSGSQYLRHCGVVGCARPASHPRQCMPNPIGRSGTGAGVEAVAPLFARPFDFNFGTEEDEKEGRPSCVPTQGTVDEGISCTGLPPRCCQSRLHLLPVGPLCSSTPSM